MSPANQQPLFNVAELASYEEARALRDYINSTQAFARNPILAGDDKNGPQPVANPNFPWLPPTIPNVGIYLPKWEGGPAGFAEPNATDPTTGVQRLFLHFRMTSGKEGFNVGLWIDKFKRYPAAASYVLAALAAEANS